MKYQLFGIFEQFKLNEDGLEGVGRTSYTEEIERKAKNKYE